VRANYVVSEILEKKKLKPFSDGEITKECLVSVGIAVHNKKTVSKISLSRFTVGRGIES